jgi:AAA domain, putative AbiEii toxin, Type IV TA system
MPGHLPRARHPYLEFRRWCRYKVMAMTSFIRLHLSTWRNFASVDVRLQNRVFVIGPNAAGKSNLLDAFRFLHI